MTTIYKSGHEIKITLVHEDADNEQIRITVPGTWSEDDINAMTNEINNRTMEVEQTAEKISQIGREVVAEWAEARR